MEYDRVSRCLFRLLVALNLAIGLSYLILLVMAAREDYLWRADFSAYYTGAKIVWDGQADQLYDFNLQAEVQLRILGANAFQGGLLPYITPPHFAFLLAPLASLPLSSAYWIWLSINLLAFVGSAWLMLCLAKDWQPIERLLLVSILAAFPATMRTLISGTASSLALFCGLLVYVAAVHNWSILGAIGLVLGAIRPQVIIPVTLCCILTRHWRMLALAAVLGLVTLGLVSSISGRGAWLPYPNALAKTAQLYNEKGMYPRAMPNVRGVLASLPKPLPSKTVNSLSWFGFVLYLGVTVLLWGRRAVPLPLPTDPALALMLQMGFFFGFHFYPHDALAMLLPMTILLRSLHSIGKTGVLTWLVVALSPVLLLVYEYGLKDPLGFRGEVLLALGLMTWALAMLSRLSWRVSRTGVFGH